MDLIAAYDTRAVWTVNGVPVPVTAETMAAHCVRRLSEEWPDDVFAVAHNGNFVEIYNVTDDIANK
ncbi:MAG TPA: hypothetical protein VIY48_14215 [Candidatus Paceibacterota bacterium]